MAIRQNRPQTPIGQQITLFCARTGMTKQTLAMEAGVSYRTMVAISNGVRPGRDALPKLLAYMAQHDGEDSGSPRG